MKIRCALIRHSFIGWALLNKEKKKAECGCWQVKAVACVKTIFYNGAIIFLHSHYDSKIVWHDYGCFIYNLGSSNSSSITFWTSQFGSSSRSNWTGVWTVNSNGSRTDKQSSHFSKRDECKSCILFHVRTLDLRVQVHPGELWVSKQRVHTVLEVSKLAGAKGGVPKICGFLHTLHPC